MKITLPLPPNMANSRLHWRVKNKARKEYFTACDYYGARSAWTGEHDPSKWRLWEKVKVKATIYCGGRMDDDNAIARLKWPIDWMVKVAYLSGDRSSQLEWDWPIKQVIKRDGNYRVEFELEAAAHVRMEIFGPIRLTPPIKNVLIPPTGKA